MFHTLLHVMPNYFKHQFQLNKQCLGFRGNILSKQLFWGMKLCFVFAQAVVSRISLVKGFVHRNHAGQLYVSHI